jgi:hypothetical protein
MDIPDAGTTTRPAYSILEPAILMQNLEGLFQEIQQAKALQVVVITMA